MDVVASAAQVPITVLIMTEIECVTVSSLRHLMAAHEATCCHQLWSTLANSLLISQLRSSLINSCQQVMVSEPHGVTIRPDMTRRARMIQLQSTLKLVSLLDNYNPSCTMSFEESSRWYLWQYGMLLPGSCFNNVIHYHWAVLGGPYQY